MAIGAYTVIDAAGARCSSGFGYGIALTIGAAIALSAVGLARGRGPAFVAAIERSWARYVVSGACLTAAYSLVLVAVRHAPVGYVATLRESSVVIGAVAGWVILREQQGDPPRDLVDHRDRRSGRARRRAVTSGTGGADQPSVSTQTWADDSS